MTLDYHAIGERVARRRSELHMTQAQVAEQAGISVQHQSNIERAVSIPSTEVIMRIADALDTTPDEFLVGAAEHDEAWRTVAELLRPMNARQLKLAQSFLRWLSDEQL